MTEPQLPEETRKEISRASFRWTLPATAGLGAGLIAIALVLALSLSDAARDRDRAAARTLTACRDRNSAQEVGRVDMGRLLDGIRVELPDADALIDRVEAGLSSAVDTDSDCDGDGWLTIDDYGIPKPDYLPVELPATREDPPS